MKQSYQQLIKKYRGACILPVLQDEPNGPTLESISRDVTGPVMLGYVWWILQEAQKRNIHRLYFLARDGYLLREIAVRMCKAFSLQIDCRYLYCSRASLRSPSFWFLGEEAYDLLLSKGSFTTVRSILARAGLHPEEESGLLEELKISLGQVDNGIEGYEFDNFVARLRVNRYFRHRVEEISRSHYANAVGYFQQEGLMEEQELAIVDSGWIGSMQRSLRQLLHQAGWKGHLTGFYFGMYRQPKETQDGTYLTWYFSKTKGKYRKMHFCNNLFECMLSAPHGMTVGYVQQAGKYMPVCNPMESVQMHTAVQSQINAALSYVDQALSVVEWEDFEENSLLSLTSRLLDKLMYQPTREEVVAYEPFTFSDDTTDSYNSRLVEQNKSQRLQQYLLLPRIMRRLFRRQYSTTVLPEPFWLYGEIAYLPTSQRAWYRCNVLIWEWLRYTLGKG